MGTREILSLQFGHYSNFIGTHWWNIQESSFNYDATTPSEINHDVLFREGKTTKGEVTFTPRLLLVDLKGSLQTLSESGSLYDPLPEPSKTNVNWENQAVEMRVDEQVPKNSFQQDLESVHKPTDVFKKNYKLEKDVRVWSDFLYTRFHPRTINVINAYEHENENSQFDVFPLGTNMWKSEKFEEFSDRIRNYIEECDSFQGFHVALDATNGFAGLATSCIEHLKDEYERKSVLAFPVIPPHHSDYLYVTNEQRHQSLIKDAVRALNLALCFDSLSEHSSLFSPLCTSTNGWRQPGPKREFYHVLYDHKLSYHTSAILASALDTITLKHRLKSTQFSLSDLCVDLNVHGRKAAAASVCLPFSFNRGADFIDCLDNWDGPLTKSISPSCSIGTDRMMQTFTLRGIPENRLKQPSQQASKQKDLPAYRCKTISEMLSLYLSCNHFLSINNVTTVSEGLSVKTPYPHLFDPHVGVDGNITAEPRFENLGVESIPIIAGLHSGASVGDMIESLHTDVKRIKFPRFHQFNTAGLESQEFTECLDRLFDLRECYEEKYNI